MRTEDIIIRLFCMVDEKLGHVNKRSNAHLYRSRNCHNWHPVHPQRGPLSCLLSLAQRRLVAFVSQLAAMFAPVAEAFSL
jgi:hypothetical protein